MSKQIVLVAARSLRHFLTEIPFRFEDVEPLTVYRNSGRVETKHSSYRYIRDQNGLRGYHGIKFEVWGPHVDWVDRHIDLIRCAERP